MSNSFPSNPSNGQLFTRFGKQFTYNSTLGVWQARQSAVPRVDLASLATDITPAASGEVSLGTTDKPFSAAHIQGALFLNGREVTESDLLNFDLTIAPEVLAIQVAAPFAGHGDLWLWTWTASTLPYSRVDITNSPQLSVPLYKQGTYQIDNFAGREIYGPMTQTHTLYLKWIDGSGTQNVVDWVTSSVVTTSHPDINDGEPTEVQRLNLVVPSTVTPPTLTPPTVAYNVSFTTPGAYTIMGANMGNNINLGPFYRGGTYTFNLDSSLNGHPFYLTTDNGANFASGQYFGEYTSGVTGSRNQSGTLVFTVPQNAPDTLFYQCGIHAPMRGAITIKDLEVETNANGNYILYFQHGKEGHKTPVEIRPIPSLVNQMCLVYDQANAKFVPQDLATYVERTPSFKNKIQEVAGTATLIAPDGVPVVPTVSIVEDASYLPLVGNKEGDITYASDTETLYIWANNAWKSTKETADTNQIYQTASQLPGSAQTGALAYVTSDSKLYFYTGSQWVSSAPTTKNFFHIVQTGSFTGPIVGDAEYSPDRTITITSIEADLASNVSGPLVFQLLKNGTSIQQFTVLSGQSSLESDVTTNSINTSDVITMNIVSGSGQDLAVRIIYR